jgi:predicted ATPase
MISNISLSNFKCWERIDNLNISKLTGIFGTNSSGKTSLLEFLLMVKQTTQSPDRKQVLNFGSEKDYVELGSFNDTIFNHDSEKALSFDILLKYEKAFAIKETTVKAKTILEANELLLKATINSTKARRLFVNDLSYTIGNYKFNMRKQEKDRYDYKISSEKTGPVKNPFIFKRTPGRAWALPEPIKFYGFPDQVRAYYQNAGFLFDLQLLFEKAFSNVYYLGPLRDYPKRQYTWTGSQPYDMGRRGENFVDAILASRQNEEKIPRELFQTSVTLEEYIAIWLKNMGLIEDFGIEEIASGSNLYRVFVRKNKNSAKVLLTDVGFGVSQVLPVITLCYYVPKGSTIIIEQPEIHLHPKIQANLADVFIDAIKKRDIQIILESHSEHLLRRLQRRISEEVISNQDVSLYFCENNEKSSSIKSLDVDLFGSIQNWPNDFFGDEFGDILAMNEQIIKRKGHKK